MDTDKQQYDATILITSLNRKDDLERAVASVCKQKGNYEIMVIDDGSSDGTSDMIKEKFPNVRLITNPGPSGCAGARNQGNRLASADYIITMDDDAYTTDEYMFAKALKEFNHPQIGAVAMPYLEDGELIKGKRDSEQDYITDWFIGAAHINRKDIFLKLGGFRQSFIIYGEEPDYCMRLLQAGYVVKLAETTPLVHEPNPVRDPVKNMVRRWKNEFAFKWYHTPFRYLPATLFRHISLILMEYKYIGIKPVLNAVFSGLGRIFTVRSHRDPVDVPVYELWRELRKNAPLPFNEAIKVLDESRTHDNSKIRVSGN